MIERKVSRMDVFQRVRDLGTKTAPTDEAITRARGELAEAIRGSAGGSVIRYCVVRSWSSRAR